MCPAAPRWERKSSASTATEFHAGCGRPPPKCWSLHDLYGGFLCQPSLGAYVPMSPSLRLHSLWQCGNKPSMPTSFQIPPENFTWHSRIAIYEKWFYKNHVLAGAKRREFSGMIHWLTINNHPSNPQQPIHSLRLAPVSVCCSMWIFGGVFPVRFQARRRTTELEAQLAELRKRPGGSGFSHGKSGALKGIIWG